MDKRYYALRLNEPAAPAFCSFDRMYIGTLEEISMVMERLRMIPQYVDITNAWDAFLAGNKEATHNVAFSDIRLLQPVQLISSAKLTLSEKFWDHINVWGFPYRMKFSSAEVAEIVVKVERSYYRCIRAWLMDLCYKSFNNTWCPLTDGFWGNEFILDVSTDTAGHSILNNLLYEVEDSDEVLQNFDDLILDPDKLNFTPICEEIFADG